MKILLLSMVIGVAAGFLDILPMLIKKMDTRAIASAFLQYFFVAIIIVHMDIPGIAWWLQGGLVSFAMAIPVSIIVSATEKKAVPVILGMSLLLGTLIGIAGHVVRGQ